MSQWFTLHPSRIHIFIQKWYQRPIVNFTNESLFNEGFIVNGALYIVFSLLHNVCLIM